MNIKLDEWSGAEATHELHKTVKTFVESNNNQSQKMINLTWAIVAPTIIMAIGLTVQIYLRINT